MERYYGTEPSVFNKCCIHEAHILKSGETAALTIPCAGGETVAVDRLQPEGRKIMDAKSFINGYGNN